MTIIEFLLARIAEDDEYPGCEGYGEYVSCRDLSDPPDVDGCVRCANGEGPCKAWPRPRGPCGTLRLLASVYTDHPDYREEWRP